MENFLVFEKRQRYCGASKSRTLLSTINSIFQKQLSEQELNSLLSMLQKQGVVTVNGTKVGYPIKQRLNSLAGSNLFSVPPLPRRYRLLVIP